MEKTDNVSDLAQDIWNRYGKSPGVLAISSTLGLARRASRISAGILPVLADVLRRWTKRDDFLTGGGWSSMRYAVPFAVAKVSPAQIEFSQPVHEQSSNNPTHVRPTPEAQSTGIQRKASKSDPTTTRPTVKDKNRNTSSSPSFIKLSNTLKLARRARRSSFSRQSVFDKAQRQWLNSDASEFNDHTNAAPMISAKSVVTEIDVQRDTTLTSSAMNTGRETIVRLEADSVQTTKFSPLIYAPSGPPQQPVGQNKWPAEVEPSRSVRRKKRVASCQVIESTPLANGRSRLAASEREVSPMMRSTLPPPLRLPGRSDPNVTSDGIMRMQTRLSGEDLLEPWHKQPLPSRPSPSFPEEDRAIPDQDVSEPSVNSPQTGGIQEGSNIVSEASGDHEVNADVLVEKVLRKLLRRVAVEEERRGLQRWL